MCTENVRLSTDQLSAQPIISATNYQRNQLSARQIIANILSTDNRTISVLITSECQITNKECRCREAHLH